MLPQMLQVPLQLLMLLIVLLKLTARLEGVPW